MLKWLTLAGVLFGLVIGGSIFSFQYAKAIVKPQEIAFILQNGQVVRELKPGLHWKIPFIQQIVYMEPRHILRQPVVIKGVLSDGNPCKMNAYLIYRVVNIRRAFEWRYANKLEISRKASKIPDYVYPQRFVESMLIQRMKETTSLKAANGAIEKWVWKSADKAFRAKTHADGTRIVQLRITAVSCSKNKDFDSNYSLPKRKYEQPQLFATSQSTPPKGVKIYKGKPFSATVMLNNKRLVTIDHLTVQFVIVNEERFNKIFAPGATGKAMAVFRITPYISSGILQNIMRIDPIDIGRFDFSSVFRTGSNTAKKLDSWGIQLIGVSSNETTYRLQVRDTN